MIKSGQPCDQCGSSDAYSYYENGEHCFSCSFNLRYKEEETEDNLSNNNNTLLEPLGTKFEDLEDREISEETAKKYGVYLGSKGYVFPFFSKDGKHYISAKLRKRASRDFWSVGPIEEAGLFGQQLFPPGSAKTITVTEGEFDALAASEMQGNRYPVVSIKNGAKSAVKSCQENYEYLNSFQTIVLCFDKDEAHVSPTGNITYPGQEAAVSVANLFALGKVKILTLKQFKDSNDYLKHRKTKEFISEWWQAPDYKPSGLKYGKDMWDEIIAPRKFESVPYPWSTLNSQTYGIRLSEFVIITGFPGDGKALALDTKIPTPSGWTTMEKLQINDIVFDECGNTCKVIFVTSVQNDRDCYCVIFDDGSKIIADADHQWVTNDRKERVKNLSGNIRTTEQIKDSLIKGDHANHSIPVCGALDLSDELLEIPPYTLGAWLGDGSSKADIIWSNDTEVIEYVQEDGYTVTKTSAKFGYRVHGLRNQLRLIDVLGNKHIPLEYLRASKNQRFLLLQGLMDTDGYCAVDNKTCEFVSVNKVLAFDVLELCLSLGIKATLRTGRATLYGKDCGEKYRIHFTTRLPVFRLTRKLSRLPTYPMNQSLKRYVKEVISIPSVPVKCIQVDSPSSLYLVGKSMIPTHNTSVLKEISFPLITDHNSKVGFLFFEEPNYDTVLGLMSIGANKPLHLPDVREHVSEKELRNVFDNTVGNDRTVLWDHFGSNSIHEVLAKIHHMAALGCKYIVLDHLSIIVSDQSGDERKQLDEISTKLKTVCMEANICVIAAIHQSRSGAIRGSMGPEQLANLVIKLYRDKEDIDPWRRNVTKMVIEKNRFTGRTGPSSYVFYDSITGRLNELDEEEIQRYEGVKE